MIFPYLYCGIFLMYGSAFFTLFVTTVVISSATVACLYFGSCGKLWLANSLVVALCLAKS